MDETAAAFLSTLFGAFLGVAAPHAIGVRLERRNYRRALDIAFVACDGYVQGIQAGANFVLAELKRHPNRFAQLAPRLIRNFEAAENVAPLFVSAYAKFLRPQDLFLLAQAEQNLRLLIGNLADAADSDFAALDNALGALREHAARRSWIVFGMSRLEQRPFSIEAYNGLITALNTTPDRRVTLVAYDPPLAASDAAGSIVRRAN
jgi:hypothetical protein